ncbi:MAG: T9SS type A sorting domain-containing protein [Saprospiraceae bacterium]|nr:T9SS type A sorting domain-containing protein [Saprospiraceae bacterium]
MVFILGGLISGQRQIISKQVLKRLWLPAKKAPVADFGYGNWANWNGTGYPVRFNEACSWDPDSFLWEFEGGNPANSTDKFPKVIFQDTGFHKITLIASGTFGKDTIFRNIYISPKEIEYDASMIETFENEEEANNLVLFNLRGTDWKLIDNAAKTGTKSFFNPGNSQYVSGFFTHIFELGSTPKPGRQLTFDVALGMSSSGSAAGGLRIIWKRPENFDRSDIFGQNEGTSLVQGDIILPELIKTATTNNAFTPNADQWKTITLPIPDTLTGEIQIGFLWANFIPTTKFKGLYIDNIRITGTTGVNDAEASRQFLVFPNPTSDYFSLDIPTDLRLTNAELRMYDLYGRLVMSKKGLEIQESQDISTLPNGIYFIELKENGRAFRNKLLITK